MFLGRKNQYCENDYTTKPHLQIKCDIPIKLPMAFFTELEQKNLKICMETKKTLNNQRNLEGRKKK